LRAAQVGAGSAQLPQFRRIHLSAIRTFICNIMHKLCAPAHLIRAGCSLPALWGLLQARLPLPTCCVSALTDAVKQYVWDGLLQQRFPDIHLCLPAGPTRSPRSAKLILQAADGSHASLGHAHRRAMQLSLPCTHVT